MEEYFTLKTGDQFAPAQRGSISSAFPIKRFKMNFDTTFHVEYKIVKHGNY